MELLRRGRGARVAGRGRDRRVPAADRARRASRVRTDAGQPPARHRALRRRRRRATSRRSASRCRDRATRSSRSRRRSGPTSSARSTSSRRSRAASGSTGSRAPCRRARRRSAGSPPRSATAAPVADVLVGAGLRRGVSRCRCSRPPTSPRAGAPTDRMIEVENPLRAEESILRPGILPGLLRAVAYNAAHGDSRRRAVRDRPRVPRAHRRGAAAGRAVHLAVAIAGTVRAAAPARPIARSTCTTRSTCCARRRGAASSPTGGSRRPRTPASTRPARRGARRRRRGRLGRRGRRRVSSTRSRSVAPVVACEIDVDALLAAPRRDRAFRAPSPYPPSTIDLAFVVADDGPGGGSRDDAAPCGRRAPRARRALRRVPVRRARRRPQEPRVRAPVPGPRPHADRRRGRRAPGHRRSRRSRARTEPSSAPEAGGPAHPPRRARLAACGPGNGGPATLYAVLGVSPSAGTDEIAAAYRARAKEVHPDARPGDHAAAEQFKDLGAAYGVLSEPESRREYDRYRLTAPRSSYTGYVPGPRGAPPPRPRAAARRDDRGHRPRGRPVPADPPRRQVGGVLGDPVHPRRPRLRMARPLTRTPRRAAPGPGSIRGATVVDTGSGARLEFTTPSGRVVNASLPEKTGSGDPVVGEQQKIRYDPTDPTDVITDTDTTARDVTLWIVSVKLLICGPLLVIFGRCGCVDARERGRTGRAGRRPTPSTLSCTSYGRATPRSTPRASSSTRTGSPTSTSPARGSSNGSATSRRSRSSTSSTSCSSRPSSSGRGRPASTSRSRSRSYRPRLGNSSLDLSYTASVEGRPVCTGLITYVSVKPGSHESVPIPAELRAKLESCAAV